MSSAQSGVKRNLKFDSIERSRDRLRKRVEEDKKPDKDTRKKDNDQRSKTGGGRSKSPVKPVKSAQGNLHSPIKQHGETSSRKRSRASMETAGTSKEENKEKRARSASPMKEMKSGQKKKIEVEVKKGKKGRPVGWRKGDPTYSIFSGFALSPASVKAAKKIKKVEKRPANMMKKKYNREVTPCPEEESKGVGTRKKSTKVSPMKTRALQKQSEKEEKSLVARCVLCRSKDGELQSCAECNALYHLRKCCRYSDEASIEIENGGRKRWLCARCTACALCSEYISDPHNVECRICTMTYHGKCLEKGGKMVDGCFTCDGCIKKAKHINKGEKEVKKEDGNEKKNGKTGRKSGQRSYKGWAILGPEKEVEEEKKRIEERDVLYDQLMEQVTKSKTGNANSPCKYGIISSSPQKLKKVALQSDMDIFEAAKAALALERQAKGRNEISTNGVDSSPSSSNSSLDIRHQWIYVGSKKDKMKSIYSSPYPQEIVESSNVFICPFCLRANSDEDTFRIHQRECTWNCPPGNEIYRDNDKKLSFFEVDGVNQKLYCRRVCLLGKLFISSKTLVDEVETFLFYVLVEHTNHGCEFVGYFSKEKNPSKNNNLSCILTLPSAMRSGYGRLLIDLSYELSRVEKKIGSPEHPLSDLGLLAYMGFWRSSILCYLRSLRGTQVASVKQISLATRIAPHDVINQLMRDKLLFYKDGMYFVNTEQRAYRMPLALTRRKTIDHSKLKWEPIDASHEHLDSSRLNYYV